MGCIGRTCRNQDYEEILNCHNMTDKPIMRMCAPGKDSTNFADVGDKVVLYVDFGEYCLPCPLQYDTVERGSPLERIRATASAISYHGKERYEKEVMIAGQVTNLILLHPAAPESKVYKAIIKIPFSQNQNGLQGGIVLVTLPYMTIQEEYAEITQENIDDPQNAVYFQSLWKQLKEHNQYCYRNSVLSRSSSLRYGGRYGSLAQSSPGGTDGIDGSGRVESVEQEAVRSETQRREYQKPRRLWPDSWQMKCWKNCCDGILRSKNPILKFIAQFFVAPLTNVTGLSLYYQLYLSEIFHTTFWTRILHYLFMPLIVLMMLIFFAQWRFVFDNNAHDCYRNNNFQVLIINAALLLALLLFVWYLIWGIIQKTYLMGIFMILPLTILVILANIYFQVSIKNTLPGTYPCHVCWKHTIHANGMVQYYNLFDDELMHWYYNPVLWVGVLSMCQSLSHLFEPKIPPRVSQTAHWMSCGNMCKRMGYTKALCILGAQAVFGAVDEFLASPKLLPIFILRVCYELGYNPKEWKQMKKLVKKCSEYGDPALDFIGVGGASHPSISSSSIINDDSVSMDEHKKEVQSMEHTLSHHQRKILTDPALLHQYKNQGTLDPLLSHYVTLRHYVAQYTLQVYAYGPFRDRHDEDQAKIDDDRMLRDFGNNPSFLKFLNQVRLSLWKMEDDLLSQGHLCNCCNPHVEEV